ncbi:Disease resistance protein RRS1 [Madurella mycetomatis]|uniref:Disease resistance protein RRS1 n=1 Tax=Madurella mycetomatis TaxID=100816 RepID=A0A175W2A3_9PEZI|nr:Disease resistance protein RRS1 [Madurella mycetomatis]
MPYDPDWVSDEGRPGYMATPVPAAEKYQKYEDDEKHRRLDEGEAMDVDLPLSNLHKYHMEGRDTTSRNRSPGTAATPGRPSQVAVVLHSSQRRDGFTPVDELSDGEGQSRLVISDIAPKPKMERPESSAAKVAAVAPPKEARSSIWRETGERSILGNDRGGAIEYTTTKAYEARSQRPKTAAPPDGPLAPTRPSPRANPSPPTSKEPTSPPFLWHVGDGPRNTSPFSKLDSSPLPAYLFDARGAQVTPSIVGQRFENEDDRKKRQGRVNRIIQQRDSNAPEEPQYTQEELAEIAAVMSEKRGRQRMFREYADRVCGKTGRGRGNGKGGGGRGWGGEERPVWS